MALKIQRGTHQDIEIPCTNAGVPVDLTGYTIFFAVKSNPNPIDKTDATAKIKKTITPAELLSPPHDAVNGRAILQLVPDDTDDVLPGDYFYGIQFKTPAGRVFETKPLKCKIEVDVNQRTS